MAKYKFLFDLDSTITKEEILPKIACMVGKLDEMRSLTERTMSGELPFKESFRNRVELLSNIPVSQVQDLVENILLNDKLVDFIRSHKEDCYIVTGNLDVWIEKLVNRIGLNGHCFCSYANVVEDKLLGISKIIDKLKVVQGFSENLVIVGDGNNDAEMISVADVGIGFGGVRNIAPAVLRSCQFAIYDENTLVNFLNKFV